MSPVRTAVGTQKDRARAPIVRQTAKLPTRGRGQGRLALSADQAPAAPPTCHAHARPPSLITARPDCTLEVQVPHKPRQRWHRVPLDVRDADHDQEPAVRSSGAFDQDADSVRGESLSLCARCRCRPRTISLRSFDAIICSKRAPLDGPTTSPVLPGCRSSSYRTPDRSSPASPRVAPSAAVAALGYQAAAAAAAPRPPAAPAASTRSLEWSCCNSKICLRQRLAPPSNPVEAAPSREGQSCRAAAAAEHPGSSRW